VLDVADDCHQGQIYGPGTCPARRCHLHALRQVWSGRTSLDVGCYMQTEGRLYHADGSKSSTKRDARGHIDPVVLRSGRRLRDRLDGSITHLGGSHVRSSRPILDLGATVEDMNSAIGNDSAGFTNRCWILWWRCRYIRGCLISSHILSSQSVASHKSVAAIKSMAKKLEAKLWQELTRKLTLWQVGHIINEVWQITSVAKTKHKPNNLWLPKFSLANCGWEPNRP
jgi:hypothetical protein